MRRVLPLLTLLLLLAGPGAVLAQPVPTNPGARSSAPTQSQPAMGANSGHPGASGVGTETPSTPVPGHHRAGNFWYWIVAIIVIAVIIWGAPRFFRRIKGPPRRKP